MTYIRKTRDIWAIQGQYEGAWETVSHYADRAQARSDLKAYRAEEPYIGFRLKMVREAL